MTTQSKDENKLNTSLTVIRLWLFGWDRHTQL